MPKRRQLRGFDLRQIAGFESLVGVDEAGRGALAGPVVAAAVRVDRAFLESRWAQTKGARINDSKQLPPELRAALADEIEQLFAAGAVGLGVGRADVGEIESFNILGATKLAMRRALEQIYPAELFQARAEPDLFTPATVRAAWRPAPVCRILVDGVRLKAFAYPHEGVVHGDARSLCIAMASIVAKVARDRAMDALDREYPGYGFARHKGYGTEEHRAALLSHGRCFQHRDTFLRTFLGRKGRDLAGQLTLFGDPASD